MEYVELIVIAAMVLVNAVFAAYEIALASISVSRLETLVNEKRRGAVAARFMKNGIEKSLAVVQLGITLVSLIAGATGIPEDQILTRGPGSGILPERVSPRELQELRKEGF